MSNLEKAKEIAKRDLKACYGKKGIFAGTNHFKDYWARDSFFASLGSLAINDKNIVKKNLELFLENVKAGQIPLRVGKTSFGVVLSYLGFKSKDSKRKPIYHIDKSKAFPKDQNSLFIITLYEYLKKTKDKKLLKDNIHKIENIVAWNLGHTDKDLLIEEEKFCNWTDSVKKQGKVLYTNVCHCYSLFCISELFRLLKDKNKQKKYLSLYEKVKEKINEIFWNGEHYIDWIHKEKIYSYFSSDGNFLGVLWDIADKENKKHVEEAAHLFDIHDVPSQCVHPVYPKRLISEQIRLVGLGDYHNGLSWLWLGSINALAKYRVEMKKEAKEMLEKIADIIVKHNGVYEVYDKKGLPVKRIIYKAEQPFAWSSGLFLYAVNQIS